MDDIPGFLAAILDDPESTAPRLAFADWLEARGDAGRARWIRASCAFAGVPLQDPRWRELLASREAAFADCRPAWWEELTGVEQQNDSGIFRFRVGSSGSSRNPRPLKRLAKAAWIGRAVAEGWLARIEVLWSDSELAGELARWKGAVLEAPLLLRPAPQIGDDGLRMILELPSLQGLELLSNVLRNPSATELDRCGRLVDLSAELRHVQPDRIDAMLDRIAGLGRLRRLHLKGHDRLGYGDRPNNTDVERLAALPALRILQLTDAPAVDEAVLDAVRRSRPGLTVVRKP